MYSLLSPPDFGKKRGSVLLGFPTPFPLVLPGYSVFAVELVPQPAVHESLAPEYLLIISRTVLIFVALLTKELLKVLSVKVVDSLTAEVFQRHTTPLSSHKERGIRSPAGGKYPCCCQGKMSGFNVQRFCQSDSFQTTRADLSSSATCFRRVGVEWPSRIRFNVGPEIPNSFAACLRVIAFCSS